MESLVGWVDCEGFGDQDVSYDMKLAVPILANSRVVIYNHKGAPTVSEMLDQLSVLARNAELIDVSEGESAGKSSSKSNLPRQHRTPLGHLHVILRDFCFDTKREDVTDQILCEEFVPAASLRSPRKDASIGGGHDPARSARERNDIRHMLKTSFASINVWLLTQPADPAELKLHRELPEAKINALFESQLHGLLSVVAMQLSRPPAVHLSGPKLAELLARNVQQVNRDGRLKLLSAVEAMEREHTVSTGAALVGAELEAFTLKTQALLPLSNYELQRVSQEFLDGLLSAYDTKLQAVVSSGETDRATRRKEIEKACEQRFKLLKHANREVTTVWLDKVCSSEFAECRRELLGLALGPSEAKAQHDKGPPKPSTPVLLSGQELDNEYQRLKRSTFSRINISTQGVAGVLEQD